MNKHLIVAVLSGLTCGHTLAQEAVSELWTNYGVSGFWHSETNTEKMDNDAIVLGFKCGETIFSTGVNDAAMEASLGSDGFTPLSFESIPIPSVTASGGQYYKGAAWDGDLENSTPATSIDADSLATYLTDGDQGLNVTTGINNIPEMLLTYLPADAPNADKMGDGIPDFLFSQIAWTGGVEEKIFLSDSDGDILGDTITLTFSDWVTKWFADGWTINSGNNATTKADRPMYLTCIELSDFNLSTDDVANIAAINVKTSGSSDPAFFAYNSVSFGLSGDVMLTCLEDNKVHMRYNGATLAEITETTIVDDKVLFRWIWENYEANVVGNKVYSTELIDN